MPKRVGNLWERVIHEENCTAAEIEMTKNKSSHNRTAMRIKANPEKYGHQLCQQLIDGYEFHPYREKDITDSYKGKIRHLKIPCMIDQAAMQAWLLVATPYIVKRNYYYNCGSIPGAGQIRAINAVKDWLNSKKPIKYAAVLDIKKFYDSCPHALVMRGLRRIFKDEKFLEFAQSMLDMMSDNGIGLAIGFPVSHWFANVALMQMDYMIKQQRPDVKYVRYMDDMVMVCNNKRHLRGAILLVSDFLVDWNMRIKHTWQLFQISFRGISFLSYRFFHRYTLLAKLLMYRIARRIKRMKGNLSLYTASVAISYNGILKHFNSYNFRKAHIYPYVSFKMCQRLIRGAA